MLSTENLKFYSLRSAVQSRHPVQTSKESTMSSIQQLANRLKDILGNPELIKRLAEQDAIDGSISTNLDRLDELTEQLVDTYKK